MAPGGLYVYVASRNYYRTLCERQYAQWPEDWLRIAGASLELVEAADDDGPELRGYIKRVYRRR
jgi:hypothetical protein